MTWLVFCFVQVRAALDQQDPNKITVLRTVSAYIQQSCSEEGASLPPHAASGRWPIKKRVHHSFENLWSESCELALTAVIIFAGHRAGPWLINATHTSSRWRCGSGWRAWHFPFPFFLAFENISFFGWIARWSQLTTTTTIHLLDDTLLDDTSYSEYFVLAEQWMAKMMNMQMLLTQKMDLVAAAKKA
jgi:hypothetical protein